MDLLLTLLLILRLAWKLAPYALAVLGAAFVMRYARVTLPPLGWLLAFLAVATMLAGEFRGAFSDSRQNRHHQLHADEDDPGRRR